MRNCPDCSVENMNESLFCKHCGRCLLAPDPEVVQRSIAAPVEPFEMPEPIDFNDGQLETESTVISLKKGSLTEPAVIERWLLILNLAVLTAIAEIVRYIIIR